MENSSGNISVFNPDKELSISVTLKNINKHNVAMSLSNDGTPENPEEYPKNPNERINQMYKGLQLDISSQQTIIIDSDHVVWKNCMRDWRKRNNTDDSKKNNPFEEEDNDFNELRAIADFLDGCEQKIIIAKQTKTLDDDFVLEKQDNVGELILELSKNFFKMRKELRDTYREIYGILIDHEIVSSGKNEDEEVTEKEKEEELRRRMLHA